MNTFSTIIVDDETAQQKLLSDMLKDFRNYRVVSVCSSVDEAKDCIKEMNPDLVFLDVVMPPKTGFDVLTELDEINFNFIFTTSYEKYAVQAFKVSAVDYLLKPYDVVDLAKALQKFEERNKLKKSYQHIQTLLHNIHSNTVSNIRIALPGLTGYVFVRVSDIIRCESDDMYTTFYFSDKSTKVISKNIKECEQLLEEYGFFRVHNSHLINMNCIVQYFKGDGGQVKLSDGSIVDVSRRKKDEFLRLFKKV